MNWRLAIFDFDGTLADSVEWCFRTVNELSSEFRFKPVPESDREAIRSLGTRQLLAHLELPAWKLPWVARRMRQLAARDAGQISLFPGVPAMLRRLKSSNSKLALVTSNSEASVRGTLGPELAGLFDSISCGASLFGKSARLKTVLKQLRVSPGQAIYIGDESRDAEAASAAGMSFGAVAWGYATGEALLACKPAAFYSSPEEILLESPPGRDVENLKANPRNR